MRRLRAAALDFLPPFLTDFAFHVAFFTLQHLLDARLVARHEPVEVKLALFAAAQTFVYIVGCPLFGRFSDVIGRRASAAFGSLLFAAIPTLFLAEPPEWLFYAGMSGLGVSGALFWPAIQARLGERHARADLGAAFLRFNLGWTAGKASGLALAGALFDAGWSRAALGIASLATAATVLLVLLDRGHEADGGAPVEAPRETHARPDQAVRFAFLVTGLASLVAIWGGQKTVFNFIPDLGRSIAIDGSHQGALLAALVLAQSAAFFALRRQERWVYRAPLLLALGPAGAAASLGLFYSQGFLSALLPAMLLGLTSGCAYTASLFYGTDYDERRGLRMGINEAALGVGGLLPLASGWLATRTGEPRLPYLAAAWLAIAAFVLASVLLGRARRG